MKTWVDKQRTKEETCPHDFSEPCSNAREQHYRTRMSWERKTPLSHSQPHQASFTTFAFSIFHNPTKLIIPHSRSVNIPNPTQNLLPNWFDFTTTKKQMLTCFNHLTENTQTISVNIIISFVNNRLLQANHRVKIARGLAWLPIIIFLHSTCGLIPLITWYIFLVLYFPASHISYQLQYQSLCSDFIPILLGLQDVLHLIQNSLERQQFA